MEEATRRGTEIGSDPELLAALSGIGGEEQIPRELYVAIAAVLGWVDGLK
jgi:type III secretion system FlhB-like substrate exporter